MKKYAVIVAGGSGSRMGSQLPKQFLLLQGRPVLWYTLKAFLEAYADLTIVLVVPAEHIDAAREIAASTGDPDRIKLATGGDTRFHSVRNGLGYVEEDSMIFVHDGVRCLVSPALIRRCYEEAVEKGNAVPAVHCQDSVRLVTEEGNQPVDRRAIRIIQTPQTFTSGIIRNAFQQEYHPHFTDEAGVVERMGVRIHLVEGEASNIKITRPIDLLIAGKILEERGR